MGTGAALGAAGGAAAAGMAGRHHDHNRGVDERGMGNTGMGVGNERGIGIERGMENERGMGNTGMVSSSWLQLRFTGLQQQYCSDSLDAWRRCLALRCERLRVFTTQVHAVGLELCDLL